ncbi:MAG TPA: hypothetical protein VFH80_17750 [Solirubrobacteraceae bacterium]|nr:hypothetical protein [Solirubrobacteraceae bacterium]
MRGPLGLSVLRGVNYWRGTALVNGAENPSGIVAALTAEPGSIR